MYRRKTPILMGTFLTMILLVLVWNLMEGEWVKPLYDRNISVLDFGAKGDGVQDDTKAIQAAFDSLSAKGGTVFFPKGKYRVESLDITGHNLSIFGAQAVIQALKPVFSLLYVSGTDISITGLEIHGANKAVRGITIVGGSSRIQVCKTSLHHFSQTGKEENQTAAIRIEGNSSNIIIDSNKISDVAASNTGVARGILISKVDDQGVSSNIRIENNHIENIVPRQDGDGIVIQDWDQPADILILDNYFFRTAKRAIKIQVPGVKAIDNIIENPFRGPKHQESDMYAGISVYAGDTLVRGNWIIGGSFNHGIEVGAQEESYQNVSIISNRVENGSDSDIKDSDLIRVYGEEMRDLVILDNILVHGRYGIRLDADIRGGTLEGNRIEGVERESIYLSSENRLAYRQLLIEGNEF